MAKPTANRPKYTTTELIEVEFVCPECGEKKWFTGDELVNFIYERTYPKCECTGMNNNATSIDCTDRVRILK